MATVISHAVVITISAAISPPPPVATTLKYYVDDLEMRSKLTLIQTRSQGQIKHHEARQA